MRVTTEARPRLVRDVANHEWRSSRDDGSIGIRFHTNKVDGTSGFEAVTWPGVLCYHGDMGRMSFANQGHV